MDKVAILERKLVPSGKVILLGAGRLGIRVFERLIMVHRGGFYNLTVFDGGRVEENDFYHIMKGAFLGENKASFLKRIFSIQDNSYKKIVAIPEDFSFSIPQKKEIETADIVISTIAGGNTLPLISQIANYCVSKNIPFITTNGVFGFGNEKIKVFHSLNNVTEGPALFLKNENFPSNSPLVTFVGTGKLIKDGLPITPMNLDRIADEIVLESLKKYYMERKNERTNI
ncbi:UBA/THIF-type NAD/FAD binding protein [Desulfurobacterium thermolithotrophum DSM 11699]|uniref:UBA/THIF-type NAD/FAD binding protein n=1 Tax=Desulfurobacterium thermolithotrophum (strain DSM 11699 / BSA) TaxID=868864 RepID=F0S2C2_DESTD|nr:ThiF family adenylyltransferase [Desulfurobacterium thermolithotrophum]ADY74137.1 UBA/THIF-type NAD/FAD binding protein [Desulfurobacterium thermolithotrophum DSM 11699]